MPQWLKEGHVSVIDRIAAEDMAVRFLTSYLLSTAAFSPSVVKRSGKMPVGTLFSRLLTKTTARLLNPRIRPSTAPVPRLIAPPTARVMATARSRTIQEREKKVGG